MSKAWTPSQRRMILQGLIGCRAGVTLKDGKTWDLEIVATACGLDTPNAGYREDMLIAKAYGEDLRMVTVALDHIVFAHRKPWMGNDARHPDNAVEG